MMADHGHDVHEHTEPEPGHGVVRGEMGDSALEQSHLSHLHFLLVVGMVVQSRPLNSYKDLLGKICLGYTSILLERHIPKPKAPLHPQVQLVGA